MGVRGMYKEVEKLEGQVKEQTIYNKYQVNQEGEKGRFVFFLSWLPQYVKHKDRKVVNT